MIAGAVTLENGRRQNSTLFISIGSAMVGLGMIMVVFRHYKILFSRQKRFFYNIKTIISALNTVGQKKHNNPDKPLDIDEDIKTQVTDTFNQLKGK